LIIERRSFLKGLSALFIAPAIVRASSLMPVHEMALGVPDWCPLGWLPLDGREIKKKFYPDLYRAYERMRMPMRLAMQEPDGRTAIIIAGRDMKRPNGSIMKAGAGYTILLPESAIAA
jgi:hypothetical protein